MRATIAAWRVGLGSLAMLVVCAVWLVMAQLVFMQFENRIPERL